MIITSSQLTNVPGCACALLTWPMLANPGRVLGSREPALPVRPGLSSQVSWDPSPDTQRVRSDEVTWEHINNLNTFKESKTEKMSPQWNINRNNSLVIYNSSDMNVLDTKCQIDFYFIGSWEHKHTAMLYSVKIRLQSLTWNESF